MMFMQRLYCALGFHKWSQECLVPVELELPVGKGFVWGKQYECARCPRVNVKVSVKIPS